MSISTPLTEKAGFLSPLVEASPLPNFDFPARGKAQAVLPGLEVPNKKWEDWKYINLKELQKTAFQAAPSAGISDITPYLIPGLDADTLVFINGRFHESWSDLSRNQNLIQVSPLSLITVEQQELLSQHLGSLASEEDIFTATNTAFAHEGTLIHIPKGKTAKAPLHIVHIFMGEGIPNASQSRNFLLADTHSELKVLESYHTEGEAQYFHNQVSEIIIGEEARVEYTLLQTTSDQTSQLHKTVVRQASKSLFKIFTLTFGGMLVRNSLIIKLAGEHTETHLMGTYLLNGQQQVDNFTQVHHMEPNCFSNELYKGIIDEQATAAFTGRINVYQDAQKTNAYQSSRNILLSDSANMYTKPQLEIYADDVKCSHGATTGQINQQALFYLQARGIPAKEARKMMIHAFTMEVVEHMSLQPVIDYAENLISDRY